MATGEFVFKLMDAVGQAPAVKDNASFKTLVRALVSCVGAGVRGFIWSVSWGQVPSVKSNADRCTSGRVSMFCRRASTRPPACSNVAVPPLAGKS